LHLYGDVYVSVDTHKHTTVSCESCKVLRIRPPGSIGLNALSRLSIVSLYSDEQPGRIWFHTSEVPRGEYVSMDSQVNIPPGTRVSFLAPIDPD